MRGMVEFADNVLFSDRMSIRIRLRNFQDYGSRNDINSFICRTKSIPHIKNTVS